MKQRRALATIVGGVFFLIVIVTAASYLTFSMNLFENFTENVFAVDQERENRKRESFDISRLTIENNTINLDIHNSGDIPISFTRLWIENVTGVDQVYKFDLNSTVTTGDTAEDILQNLPFVALETQTYKMKLVTDRGTTKEFVVNALTDPLHLQLFAMPEEIPTNFKATILLAVTNNSTQNAIYTNIQPFLNVTSLGATATFEGPSPEPYPVLEKGNTVIFEWAYRISGDDGDKVRFEAGILNGVSGNTITKNVEVQKIELAEQSVTALKSSILTSGFLSDNILLFHKESIDALGERQMWSSVPEDNVADGTWNTVLRYISSPMPESLMHTGSASETMSYHFGSDLDSPLDTTANTVMTLGTGSNRPQWDVTAHQGAGAFEFSGNQFATISVNNSNDLDDIPSSTSGWFNADSSGPASNQIIYFGNSITGTPQSYQIFLNQNGHLTFQIDTGSKIPTCTSAVNYKDDMWHHFVAIMPSDNDCNLWVDGILRASDTNTGNSNIILDGDIFVGAKDAGGTDGFNGLIDDLIHWDSYELIESGEQEITDLFNTNYGDSSHLLQFEMRIVDASGNNLGPPTKMISPSFNFTIPFTSDFGEYSAPINDIWGQFNITTITTEQKVVEAGERLKIEMIYFPKIIGNLNMKMVVDDADVVSGLGSSFLETPPPDRAFPGFASYDNSAKGTISIFNPGPNDKWIKFSSRVVFEHEDTSMSYAAFIDKSGTSNINTGQDSPVLAAGTSEIFEYEQPHAQPGNISSELIPEGRYRMYIFLNGYDSGGQVVLQTSTVGIVRVT
jgi:hypothetical protein